MRKQKMKIKQHTFSKRHLINNDQINTIIFKLLLLCYINNMSLLR